jgi:hypothetical protein
MGGIREERLSERAVEVVAVEALEVDDVTVTMTVLDPDDERSAARVRGDDETPLRARLAEVEALLSR